MICTLFDTILASLRTDGVVWETIDCPQSWIEPQKSELKMVEGIIAWAWLATDEAQKNRFGSLGTETIFNKFEF